jgi:type III secretory pathway component EscR
VQSTVIQYLKGNLKLQIKQKQNLKEVQQKDLKNYSDILVKKLNKKKTGFFRNSR